MNFTIKDRKIKSNDPYLIGYNLDYIAHFTFDDEWEGTAKTARFYQDDGYYDVVIDKNDTCVLPPLLKGKLRVGVFNSTMTTTYTTVWVDASIKDEHGNPIEPPEDVYAQLIALIESGMLKGEDGVGIDSIIQTVVSTESDGENIFTVTLTDGSSSEIKIRNGAAGVGVQSIEQTVVSEENDGLNIYTITLTNGETSELQVKNGSKGEKGEPGDPGERGIGITNVEFAGYNELGDRIYYIYLSDGTEYSFIAPRGPIGEPGKNGLDGADGKTPVKGEDYYTEEDKDELVNNILQNIKGVEFHICRYDEYDAESGCPVIANPKDSVFYLVPSGKEPPNIYVEWIYINESWECLGGASTNMSNVVTDIKVDGISVVSDGIASISLSSYAKKEDIPAKTSDLENDSNFVSDANYKHITVTGTSVSDGDTTFTKYDDTELSNRVSDVEKVIPAEANEANQLADKNFVNSSIATNTSHFLGTHNSLDELMAVPDPTNNDYGFIIANEDGNTVYKRYKYSNGEWTFEYNLNNSSFTAEQWATINSGATSDNISSIEVIKGDIKYTNNNPSTIAVGGIAKGTTFENKSLKSIIEDMLYPYVAFTFTSLAGGGTYEYGTKVTVKTVKPTFTKGSKDFTSVKVGTTSGGSDLYDGSTATSGANLTLTTSKQFDGNTGGTIYMTISDGTTTTTKSTVVSYAYYDYAMLSTDTNAPTSGAIKNKNDATYSYSAGQYLWILSKTISNGKLQTYVAGSWADVTTTASGAYTYTLASGATATYYAYRTDMFSANGSARYRLVSK